MEVSLALTMMTPRFFAALHVVVELVEVWQHAAAARGCHIAFWAKATPRVDVGDTPNIMGSASSSRCGLWLGNLDKVGKGKEGDKEKDEEKEEVSPVRTVCSSFPVFLRTLSGRTVVMTAVDNSTSDLLQRIEEDTQIPQHHWYCHVNGSPLSHDSAPHILHRDCTIVMCARLKGGAPTIPESGSAKCVNVAGAGQLAHIASGAAAERVKKLFVLLRVNVRLWVERHLLRELLHVPRNVGLHLCRGSGSLPITSLLNRLSWRL